MLRKGRRYIHNPLKRIRALFKRAIPLSLQKYALLGIALLVCAGVLFIVLPSRGSDTVGTMSPNQASDIDMPAQAPTAPPAQAFSPSPTAVPTATPDLTLKQGCEDSERVAELQLRLMKLGYMETDEPTQHFGPVTKHAVQLFQRQHDLQQDGIAGQSTLELINSSEAKKYTLLEGTRGDDVTSFQALLKDLGYLKKTTGYYGDETVAAVKDFQKVNGLGADGKAGQHTLDLINSDKAKQSPQMAVEKRRKASIDTVISTAKKKVGSKYRLGNTGPNTFDCSGFVYYCLKQAGSNRRRLTAAGYAQVGDWEKISNTSKLKKGDLLFFLNNERTQIGHVGIYIGGGQMIDASSSNGKVVRRAISSGYWKSNFTHARRPW